MDFYHYRICIWAISRRPDFYKGNTKSKWLTSIQHGRVSIFLVFHLILSVLFISRFLLEILPRHVVDGLIFDYRVKSSGYAHSSRCAPLSHHCQTSAETIKQTTGPYNIKGGALKTGHLQVVSLLRQNIQPSTSRRSYLPLSRHWHPLTERCLLASKFSFCPVP